MTFWGHAHYQGGGGWKQIFSSKRAERLVGDISSIMSSFFPALPEVLGGFDAHPPLARVITSTNIEHVRQYFYVLTYSLRRRGTGSTRWSARVAATSSTPGGRQRRAASPSPPAPPPTTRPSRPANRSARCSG